MTVLFGVVHHQRGFGLGDVAAEDAGDAVALAVDIEHHGRSPCFVQMKKLHQDVDHELHGRVVVVVEHDHVLSRPFRLGPFSDGEAVIAFRVHSLVGRHEVPGESEHARLKCRGGGDNPGRYAVIVPSTSASDAGSLTAASLKKKARIWGTFQEVPQKPVGPANVTPAHGFKSRFWLASWARRPARSLGRASAPIRRSFWRGVRACGVRCEDLAGFPWWAA